MTNSLREKIANQDKKPSDRGPQCENKLRRKDGGRMRCRRDGKHCFVYGEFGSMPMVLCEPCKADTIARGWRVSYQLADTAAQPQKGL